MLTPVREQEPYLSYLKKEIKKNLQTISLLNLDYKIYTTILKLCLHETFHTRINENQ